jgi:alkaline phosphatase D
MHRRAFLRSTVAAVAAGFAPIRAFGIVTQDAARPATPCGVATGDVADGRAVVWSRTDRPARLIVEYATTEAFHDVRRVIGPAALAESDFTARIDLTSLPSARTSSTVCCSRISRISRR